MLWLKAREESCLHHLYIADFNTLGTEGSVPRPSCKGSIQYVADVVTDSLSTVFAPAPTNFSVDVSLSSLTFIALQWNIPFELVPPSSFLLQYNLTKLSGQAASQTQFSLSLTAAVTMFGSSYSYNVTDVLSYTQYEFQLIAVYEGDQSSGVSASHQTPETSEFISFNVRWIRAAMISCFAVSMYWTRCIV